MADAAELALVQFFHADFVGFLGHLKGMGVTGAALGSSDAYMLIMAEKYGLGSRGLKMHIPASGGCSAGAGKCKQKKNRSKETDSVHAEFPPPCIWKFLVLGILV